MSLAVSWVLSRDFVMRMQVASEWKRGHSCSCLWLVGWLSRSQVTVWRSERERKRERERERKAEAHAVGGRERRRRLKGAAHALVPGPKLVWRKSFSLLLLLSFARSSESEKTGCRRCSFSPSLSLSLFLSLFFFSRIAGLPRLNGICYVTKGSNAHLLLQICSLFLLTYLNRCPLNGGQRRKKRKILWKVRLFSHGIKVPFFVLLLSLSGLQLMLVSHVHMCVYGCFTPIYTPFLNSTNECVSLSLSLFLSL